MSYINCKKVSYILSEESGQAGKMVYEILSKIIGANDTLRFSINHHGIHNAGIDYIAENNKIELLPSNNHKKEFIVKKINIDSRLLNALSLLGEHPNFINISKVDSVTNSVPKNGYWCIEYCDEIISFVYDERYIDSNDIESIEQKFEIAGLYYERKETSKCYVRW